MQSTNNDINALLSRYDRFINIADEAHNPFSIALPMHPRAGSVAARFANSAQAALPPSPERDWKAVRVVNEGKFGVVLEVDFNGVRRAVKVFKLNIEQDIEGELSLLEYCKNEEGIVAFHGTTTMNVEGYYGSTALMELYDGSLEEWIKNLKGPLSAYQIKQLKDQIIMTLGRLHAKELAHLDLACRNILVKRANALPIAHIGDFGHALFFGPVPDGSPNQDAPKAKENYQADIFACASIISMLDSLQTMTGIQNAIANRFRKNLTTFKASMWDSKAYEAIFKIFCGETRSSSREGESLEEKQKAE